MRMTSINPAALIPHPLSDDIFGQMGGDQLDDLKKDIAERGLQYPLELDSQKRVICGSQRLRAIQALGLPTVEVIVRDELVTEDEISAHLIKDNTLRRQLNPGQMYRAGVELERIYKAQAEERQRANLRHNPAEPSPAQGKTADRVAKEVGTSATGFKRLKRIMESGEQDLIDKVEAGQLTLSAAVQQVKARKPSFKAQTLTRDDPRSQLMAVTKFRQDVERFSRWVEARPPSTFGVYASDAAKVLQELVQAVSGLSQYAPARSG